ncbi:hypothetical protein TNCV_4139961 [Trichonephila clavipes]|nr:hypothetical protein TNCV_4139961 [Trichonephila clavipes]
MSPRQIEILKSEVNKMLELKIIEPGESDFTSPLILVEAQGKEARLCIDYRRLKKVTRTQFFPLPNIEELLEKVSAAKYISILDLTRGYWQIPLSFRALRYASFVITFGTFKPLRLPFGLKNAPYYFSRLMANLLRNCEYFAVPYLDDIAIFSLSWDDHLNHLKDVFYRLRSAKLHIKVSKCQFAQAYVKYLGHLCNASNLGIGVVLSQVCENEEHPIMFLSKTLSLAEQKYSTTEKECAAIIFAVQKLKCYLEGHQKFVPWSVKIILDRVISDRKERERSKQEEKKGKTEVNKKKRKNEISKKKGKKEVNKKKEKGKEKSEWLERPDNTN